MANNEECQNNNLDIHLDTILSLEQQAQILADAKRLEAEAAQFVRDSESHRQKFEEHKAEFERIHAEQMLKLDFLFERQHLRQKKAVNKQAIKNQDQLVNAISELTRAVLGVSEELRLLRSAVKKLGQQE